MICYHFLPGMKERGFGRIVNTTSGIDMEPEQAGYSAAKAALSKVTRDLGRDYDGSDIMISLTDPGWCRTFSAQEFSGMTIEEAVAKAEEQAV